MIKEAIILAGGLGMRLRSVVSDVPKCMAPVSGKPFLHYVIEHLKKEGVEKYIFSVGYKNEIIIDFIDSQYSILNAQFSIEKEPLGTGGAIKFACYKSTQKNTLIVNGDTLFSINVSRFSTAHQTFNADCTLSLKPMYNFERYGVVELNKDASISSFKEKQFYKSGFINGGLYALNVDTFLNEDLPEKFSFEKGYLEKALSLPKSDKRRIYGVVQDEYFIDIGIPEDYERAQKELNTRN